MFDVGSGTPVIVIPGVQGRWEWMERAINALAERCRVITDSLPGDPESVASFASGVGFDIYLGWIDALLERAGLQRVALCGVSYGGLVALHYAAVRPERTQALALVSTPSPTWTPNCRIDWYLNAPRLLSPVFALSSPFRLYPEIASAFPSVTLRGKFAVQHLRRVLRYPFRPTRMAERVRLLKSVDFAADCGRVAAPTLVITGEPGLDHVVSVASTCEYVEAIEGSRYERITRTGHIGLVTRPQRFRDIVGSFVETHATTVTSSSKARIEEPA